MAEHLDLQLDAAYQPLMHVEAVLRKRGLRDGDADLTALGEQVWSVVEALQALQRRLETADGVCGERQHSQHTSRVYVCDLPRGHDGTHRQTFGAATFVHWSA